MTGRPTDGLLDDARGVQDDLVRLRRTLHARPEVGLDLPHTQEAVLSSLDGLGLEISTGRRLSSVTAVLRGARPGPTVLLRGDMDALPVAERTGLAFASDNGAMHACGHDLHTAMLAGAARLLAHHRDRLAGDVVLMFQPGEEGYDGARYMLEEGVLDASGTRPVAAYALHVTASGRPSGRFSARGGPTMAAVDNLYVTVRGAGGHGAMPHMAMDPVPVACEMVLAMQTRVTRAFDVFDPVVVTTGSFHAGTQNNIIPDTAVFETTVRTFSPEARARAERALTEACRGVAAAHGVEAEVRWRPLYPVTVNDPGAVDTVARTVAELFGGDGYETLARPMTGSEDFSRVVDEVPGAMVFLGATPPGADPGTAPDNHSPLADFDESVLGAGAAVYAALAAGHLHGSGPGRPREPDPSGEAGRRMRRS
ncbi:MAG TPA: amidohydrolase [Streptomyces sp.]|uniref:M20 family metallopeptidase n=1 Tax=Streptomyces salyersiae TaxID=3075530 RepID=A0ABU2RFS7_9ACTN|nr:M20 family metallopeptidase [Streptomyces sp. DSM 41770]MDT0426329.1 M20 family metallopeptidase [Streptomyces sp. DSM 41770]HBF80433.1 amidohydrolase [Streptomyces sp.]